MNDKWHTWARAENVQFRMLKMGANAQGQSYQNKWKGAHVSFSSKDGNDFTMTVEYHFDRKRIDIPIGKQLAKFEVSQHDGRVTIVTASNLSKFFIKDVKPNVMGRVNDFLKCIVQVKKASLPLKHLDGQETSPLQESINSQSGSPASKRKSGELSPDEGKKQRSTLSPRNTSSEDDHSKKGSQKKSDVSKKKFDDFRRAQAAVRHDPRRHLDRPSSEEKENQQPIVKAVEKELKTTSFYASEARSSCFAYEKNDFMQMNQPFSPKRKASPDSSPTGVSPIKRTARRSLSHALKADNTEKKEDKARTSMSPSRDSSHENDKSDKSIPLSDKANITPPDKGLQNLGNTCYMNAALQALCGLLPFQTDLKEITRQISNVHLADGILMPIVNLVSSRSHSQSYKLSLLQRIKDAVSGAADQFVGFHQQDAHEFLRLCLDLVKNNVNHINVKLREESNRNGDVSVLKEHPCPVETNFSFTVNKKITCTECKNVVSRDDELYDLQVEIPQSEDPQGDTGVCLQSLIGLSFHNEEVEYQCEKCNHRKAVVAKRITKLPRIMTLCLQRVLYNQHSQQGVKLREAVSIPRYLTLQPVCDAVVPPYEDLTPPPEQHDFLSASSVDPEKGDCALKTGHVDKDFGESETASKLSDVAVVPEAQPKSCSDWFAETAALIKRQHRQKLQSAEVFAKVVESKEDPSPTKITVSSGGDNNNNNREKNLASDVYTTGNEEVDLNRAIEQSRLDFLKSRQVEDVASSSKDKPNEFDVSELSEDAQIALAIQLSMAEQKRSFDDDDDFISDIKVPSPQDARKFHSPLSTSEDSLPSFSHVLTSAPMLETSFFSFYDDTIKETLLTSSPKARKHSSEAVCSSPPETSSSRSTTDYNISSSRLGTKDSDSTPHSVGGESGSICNKFDQVISSSNNSSSLFENKAPYMGRTSPDGQACCATEMRICISASASSPRSHGAFVPSFLCELKAVDSTPTSSPVGSFQSVASHIHHKPCGSSVFESSIAETTESDNDLYKNQSTGFLANSYRLVSVVSHRGDSSKWGHYVSDVMSNYTSKTWTHYNDDYVTAVSEAEVMLGRRSTCYLLFYVEKNLFDSNSEANG